jgi:hypothetical protein
MYVDFILNNFWIILTIVSFLAIVIGFGKGIWQYCIKPLFKAEQRKDIADLDWTAAKKRSTWVGHMFFK